MCFHVKHDGQLKFVFYIQKQYLQKRKKERRKERKKERKNERKRVCCKEKYDV